MNTRHIPYLRPHSVHYYLSFAKARKNMGSLATKGYFQVMEFLNREVPLPAVPYAGSSFSDLAARPFSTPIQEDSSQEAQTQSTETKNDDDIDTIVKHSNEVLAEASTVFPFTLFPDTITLDRKKLIITIRNFFMSSRVLTIQVEEILNITVSVGPIFGALHIGIRGLTSEDHFDVRFLWRKDAIHLKHMIEGYIIALKDEIKTDHLSKRELTNTLAKLGRDSNPEKLD